MQAETLDCVVAISSLCAFFFNHDKHKMEEITKAWALDEDEDLASVH